MNKRITLHSLAELGTVFGLDEPAADAAGEIACDLTVIPDDRTDHTIEDEPSRRTDGEVARAPDGAPVGGDAPAQETQDSPAADSWDSSAEPGGTSPEPATAVALEALLADLDGAVADLAEANRRDEVGYAVAPYDAELHARVFETRSRLNLVIGCVDNAAARRAIAASLGRPHWRLVRAWWVDCGNGRNSGQVLLGNAVEPDELRGVFLPHPGLCRALPAPSLQRPDLLTAPPEPPPAPLREAPDCAEAVARGEQGPTVNQFVAALAATYVERLLAGSCSWMSSYFDLDDGLLRCVGAEPRTVAELAGLHLNAVAPVPHRRSRTGGTA